jgi:hypothetical protein
MATIFLSYRRTDSPQACRVHDWLIRRFGRDAVFMDVAAIPVAVDYADCIADAIAASRIMIVLIGRDWAAGIHSADDPVRSEIESAMRHKVPLLPVLIGNTPMPDPEDLPAPIGPLAFQNAVTVGVSNDFDTHMQSLLPTIESILGEMARHSTATADPDVIFNACFGINAFLEQQYASEEATVGWNVNWKVVGTTDFEQRSVTVTLFMHRAQRLGDVLDLHFLVSFWGHAAINEHRLAGWVMHQFERMPVVPQEFLVHGRQAVNYDLKIRRSDEDPRRIWQMITDEPLRLSLAYVATVSPT